MKYTFLLPAYKGRFLGEMLSSIQRQTYTDFKVIISDDCSPEDLQSICEPYLSAPRFTYRRNDENMGRKSLVAHWNLLVNMCDTEFLILASDDDVYEPQFLDEINSLVQKYPKVDLFRARVKRIDEQSKTLINDGVFEEWVDHLHFIHQVFLSNHIPCISNYCFRTEALKRKGGFVDFPQAWFTDDATTIMMAENGCCNTFTTLFGFRSSSINISGKWGNTDDFREKLDAVLSFYQWFNDLIEHKFGIGYVEEPLLPDVVRKACKKKLEGHATGYCINCQWKVFSHYARRCQSELGLSYWVLLYYWLRRKLKT